MKSFVPISYHFLLALCNFVSISFYLSYTLLKFPLFYSQTKSHDSYLLPLHSFQSQTPRISSSPFSSNPSHTTYLLAASFIDTFNSSHSYSTSPTSVPFHFSVLLHPSYRFLCFLILPFFPDMYNPLPLVPPELLPLCCFIYFLRTR